MELATKLEDVRKAVASCLRCNMCTYGEWPDNYTICPMYQYDKCFTYSAGGFMYLAKSLIDKKLPFDSKVSDLIFTCSGCLACDDICEVVPSSEPYVYPFDIIRLMRHEAVKEELFSDTRLERIRRQIKRYNEAVSLKGRNILEIPMKIIDENSDTVLFLEWSLVESRKETHEAVLTLLEKIGEPIWAMSDGGLDLPDLYDLGFWDKLEGYLTKEFVIDDLKRKVLVFVNPHVQEFFARRLTEFKFGYENIETRHISEVILDAIQKRKLKTRSGLPKIKVSYHDPCYLGRGLKIYDAPRELLSALDGVELIEMERNKRNAFCCGARAGNSYFSDFSEKTTLERLHEFERTGADLLITACPYCKEAFRKVLNSEEQEKVRDLLEFVIAYCE